MKLQERYKKVRFFTFPKTFFTWAGFGFPLLHDDDKEEDDKKDEEEEEEEVEGE